jgi:hypothetical protein
MSRIHIQVGATIIGGSINDESPANADDEQVEAIQWDKIKVTEFGRLKAAAIAVEFGGVRMAIFSGEGANYIYCKARRLYRYRYPQAPKQDAIQFAENILTALQSTSYDRLCRDHDFWNRNHARISGAHRG